MALKAVLDKLEDAPETVRGEYKPGEGGKFYLQLEGTEAHPDVGALARAKQHEKNARQKAETEASERAARIAVLEKEIEDIRLGAVPKGDVEALKASWATKLAEREKVLSTERDLYRNSMQALLVDNTAQDLAKKLARTEKEIPLFLPHIRGRLGFDVVDGRGVTTVLDANGKPSASTLADLEAEFVANPAFSSIIVGSKASGGGASEPSGGSSGTPSKEGSNLLDHKNLTAHLKAKRTKNGG